MISALDIISDFETMAPILGPQISIDRVVMLMYFPSLTLFGINPEDDENNEYKLRQDAISSLVKILHRSGCIDDDAFCSKSTELYGYHYRLKGGIDIQFCSHYHIRYRIDDESYVQIWGDEKDKDRGYVEEKVDQDYNIRIEFNPNKNNILESSNFFHILAARFPEYNLNALLKITRIDIAVDYPLNINPALTDVLYSKKHFIVGSTSGLESVYHNSQRSRHYFCIYNKKVELHKNKILYTGDYLWRFELRCSDSFPFYEFDFMRLYDVWNRLSIFCSGCSTGDWIMDLMLYYGSKFGMKAVFSLMPVATKARWRKKYRSLSYFPMDHPAQVYFNQFWFKWCQLQEIIKTAFGRSDEVGTESYLKSQNPQMLTSKQSFIDGVGCYE